ncbi:hypothetical protein Pcinc_028904 [Petrolisthes cinctipes]|uniref:Uncharacterized protein n=1 Tax=Petrolisthes cinctipes TaxID=88211 RepID=A0AAE1K6P4_PETCI|nr:hypothetical protein Pcinc_028904 [Petrolisthes cinctipes]
MIILAGVERSSKSVQEKRGDNEPSILPSFSDSATRGIKSKDEEQSGAAEKGYNPFYIRCYWRAFGSNRAGYKFQSPTRAEAKTMEPTGPHRSDKLSDRLPSAPIGFQILGCLYYDQYDYEYLAAGRL